MNALPANIEPAEPSESTKQALAMLDAMYEPKFADLRSRCALAAMKAAPLGALAVRAAVDAVPLEVKR
jgi:hypothetical protein